MAAGNNFEQSVALIASANKVVQDPNSVGTALRTISLRLRGTSVEVLEEMGEETDNVIESTSKLQEKIKALSGVNILTDSGEYKDTYTILKEIGAVWEDMADVDRAALLELMAGKNRANTLSAILSNMEDLNDAYLSALNAEGSAMKENETYLDSIQGKIDKFTNSLQTFWMDAISSDFVKGVVNIGTTILNILDTIVKKAGIVFPTIGALITKHLVKKLMDKNGIKGLSGIFSFAGGKLFDAAGLKPYVDEIKKAFTIDATSLVNDMVSKGVTDYSKYAQAIQSLSATKQAEVLINSKLAESEQLAILTRTLGSEAAAKQALAEAQLSIAQDKVSLSQLAQLANTGALTAEQAGLIASTLGLSSVEGGLTEITKAEALAKIQAAVATQTLSAADAEAIISTLGLSGAATVSVVGFKALAVAIWSATKAIIAFLFTNPVGWVILLTGAVIGLVAAYNKWGPTHKNFIKRLEEETENLKNIRSELESLNSELGTTKERIEELENKDSLSFTEEQELAKLKSQREELERIIKLEEARQNRALQNQLTAGLNAAKTDKNLQEQSTTVESASSYAASYGAGEQQSIGNKYEQNLNALESVKKQLDEANEKLNNAVADGMDANSKEFKDLEKNVENAQKRFDKFNTELDTLHNSFTETYGDVGYQEILDSDSEALKQLKEQWNELYRQHQMYQNKQALLNGTFTKADVLSDVFGSTGASAAQEFNKSFSEKVKSDGFENLTEGTKYAQDWMDKLKDTSPQLAKELEYCGITAVDVAGYFMKTGEYAKQTADQINTTITSLDKLTATIEAYKSALTVVNNITSDGQAISEDYYNTLKEQLSDVTVAEQGFSDAIEQQNGKYIVKNISLLQKLVNQSRKAQKATIQIAKAQGQLQYKSLVSQLKNNVNSLFTDYKATKLVSSATLENIHILQGQIDTLKETIRQYSLLEVQMSGMADGYETFAKAKEQDEQYDQYGSSMIEALKIIDKGLLDARLGTASVSAAIKAFIPDEALENATTLKEEIAAIHDYIDGDKAFSDYFTVDKEDGSFSIEAENVTAFIKDMQKAGILTGENEESFGVSAEYAGELNKAYADFNKSLKESGESAGITKEAFVAMLTEASQFSYGDKDILVDITTPKLEQNVMKATSGVEAATDKMAKFWEEANVKGEFDTTAYKKLQDELAAAEAKLKESEAAANKNAQQYNLCQAALKSYNGELKLTGQEADQLAKALGLVDENGNPTITVNEDGSLQLTDEQLTTLGQKLATLEKPTIMRMQLRYDEITEQIDTLEKYIKDELEDPEKNKILLSLGITNKDEAQKKIDELKPEQNEIGITYGITETSSDQEKSVLESYKELAKNGLEFKVTADVTDADKKIKEIDENNPKDKEVVFTADGSTASDVIKGIANQLSALPDDVSITIETKEKKTIFETVTQLFSGNKSSSNSTSSSGNVNRRSGNTIYASGTDGLQSNERNAIVGELGEELVCDTQKGVYYTVGTNGTEMVDLPKGAIIYNHKQTEELLKNGKTSRGTLTGGLSFAKGNAHAYDEGIITTYRGRGVDTSLKDGNAIKTAAEIAAEAAKIAADASDSLSDSADEFSDTINWIEVLFTRIDNTLSEHEAYLTTVVDSTGGLSTKDSIYQTMFGQMYNKVSYSVQAANYYQQLADSILSGMDQVTASKVRNGTILIEEITDEALKENIDKALDYLDQASQYKQQYYSTLEEIADKAVERQNEAATAYENEIGLVEHLNSTLEARNDLEEAKNGFATEAYYKAQINASNTMLKQYQAERKALQQVLDQEVAAGRVKIGSQQWFDMQNAIYDVDDAIIDMEASIEDLQNSINDLKWARFDELINRFGYIEDEIGNVVQLLSHDPKGLVTEELRDLTTTNWATGSGLASLGLYAEQMEAAQYVANQYADAIKELKKDYAAGRYNETEYLNKLNELISAQYENIEKYYDAKDAIIELNQTRVDAIRDGIEKEIDAYDELIQKKKDLLSREQDLRDFQDEVAEKEKEVSDIRKQLAAMAGDTTAATTAKRKQLEAQLVEAQKSLEDSYYSHSMSARQEALDKEFSDFEESKNKEIEKWEEWLKDTETVVSEALNYVKNNTNEVFTTLKDLGADYNLTMSDNLITPWQNGSNAIDSYSENFGIAVSNFTEQLDGIVLHWESVTLAAEEAAAAQAKALQAQYNKTVSQVPSTINKSSSSSTTPTAPPKTTTPVAKTISVGGKINAGSARIYADSYGGGGGRQYYANDPIYTVLQERNGYLLVRYHKLSSGYTGWFKKSDVKAYAKGTLETKKDGLSIIDELGEELVVHSQNGRLTYLSKGTGVVPADLTEKIMDLALDPTSIFDNIKTNVNVPNIMSNNMGVTMQIDKVVNIEHADSTSIPAIKKAVNEQLEAYQEKINNRLKRL